MLTSNIQLLYTVLRSDNRASGRSSGSHSIIMESISSSLIGQVNSGSTAEVNFQGSSSTHSIPTRQQDEKTVLPWGCHSGATLTLSPGVLSGLLVTSPKSVDYARRHMKSSRATTRSRSPSSNHVAPLWQHQGGINVVWHHQQISEATLQSNTTPKT